MSSLSFIILHTPGTLSSRNGLKIFLSKWITGVKLLYLQRWPHDLHLESRKVYCARERDSFFTVSTSVHVLRSPSDFPDLLLYILFKLFRPLEFHLEQYHAGTGANSWKSHFLHFFASISMRSCRVIRLKNQHNRPVKMVK